MNYPFRTCGRIIEVYRYDLVGQIDGEPGIISKYVTRQEALQDKAVYGGKVVKIDTTEVEWLNGLEVEDVPNTFERAIAIYDMGEAAYWQEQAFMKDAQIEQLRADIDYIAVVVGIPL